MYENCKKYGPYKFTNSERKFYVLIYPDGSRESTSVARYIMECHLNRKLDYNETVDHIDGDCSNDNLNNLQVLSREDNATKSANFLIPQEFICPECDLNFMIEGRKLRDAVHNRRRGKAGPFCGRSCAGKYGKKIQTKKMKKLKIKKIEREYEKRKLK